MSTETKTTEIVIPSKESLVAPIVAARAEIQALLDASKGITVAGHTEGKLAGYRAVEELRKKLKGCGTTIEKARKTAKAPFLGLGRFIDGQASELEEMFRPEEARLKKEADDYLEECRIEKEKKAKAEALRLEARLKEAGERGAAISDIDMKCAREGSDLAWAQHLQQIDALVERRALVADRKDQLDALGAEIPENLGDLTEGEFSALLEEEIELQKERERLAEDILNQQEAARLTAEKNSETRRRFDLLTALGQPVTLEACAALLPEEFEEALADAKRKKADKDEQDQRDRDELTRRRAQEETARKAKEKREQEEREADLARKDRERLAAIAPEHEKLTRWRLEVQELVGKCPTMTDKELERMAATARRNLFAVLTDLSDSMDLEQYTPEPEDIDVLLEI